MPFHWQWGNAGEWAAAVGTSAAVILSAYTIRSDRRERREREALKVIPSLSSFGGPAGPNGEPNVQMVVRVNNDGTRTIRDVRVDLVSPTGEGVDSWRCEEIFPQQMWSQARPPQPSDWAPQPSAEVFKGVVRASFIDADGKRWLRDSEGKIGRPS